jgi:heme exporter protein D
MAFDSWADFLTMGKHGVYVWSSYGLTFVVIAALLWQARQQRRQFLQDYQQQMKREAQSINPEQNQEKYR